MFRASRSFLRVAHRASLAGTANKLPQLQASKLLPIAQRARFASKSDDPPPPKPKIDLEHEKELAQQKLKADPSKVSSTSTVAHAGLDFGPSSPAVPTGKPTDTPEIHSGLKHDLSIVRDTFRLDAVPRESYRLGLAGTLPYLGTSLSTMFLAWDLSKDVPTGNAFYDAVLIDHETAQYLLTLIEPVQLGYGAVIISFLGAIHWGLEYAEKTPHPERTRFRYGMGLASSIIAWPTLFMPLEYALTTQFMAFIALYFADARAAARGWAPYWYGTYRFLLTAMVGIAIFVSLVGRSKITQNGKVDESSFTKAGIADHRTNWAKLEAEEKEKLRKEREEQAKKQAEEEAKKKKEAKKSKGKKGKKDAKAADEGDESEGDDGEKGDDKKEKKSKKKESGKSDDGDDSEDKGEDEESDDEDEGDDEKSKGNNDEDDGGDEDEEKDDAKKDNKKSKKDDKKKTEKKDDDNKDEENADSDDQEEKKDDDSEGDDNDDKDAKDGEQDEESKDEKKDSKKGDKKDKDEEKKDEKKDEAKDDGDDTNEDKDQEKKDDKDESKDKRKDKKKK